MKTIKVSDFSEFPGPRYEKHGPHSGERFRREVLLPAIEMHNSDIEIDLDGVIGYGSSFLEEAFGGLIRDDIQPQIALSIADKIISKVDPSLKFEIKSYIEEAITHKKAS